MCQFLFEEILSDVTNRSSVTSYDDFAIGGNYCSLLVNNPSIVKYSAYSEFNSFDKKITIKNFFQKFHNIIDRNTGFLKFINNKWICSTYNIPLLVKKKKFFCTLPLCTRRVS